MENFVTTFIQFCTRTYQLLSEVSPKVVYWFATPLAETSGSELIADAFGEFAPMELMFGYGIVMVLIAGLIAFVMKMSPL